MPENRDRPRKINREILRKKSKTEKSPENDHINPRKTSNCNILSNQRLNRKKTFTTSQTEKSKQNMNASFYSEYADFQEELMKNPSLNSSFNWEIRTLRSREILSPGKLSVHKPSHPKLAPKKSTKSVFRKIAKILFCATDITEEAVVQQKPEILEKPVSQLKNELNDLKLVQLSYQAEMANLREEIEKLNEEKRKLIEKQRSCKKIQKRRKKMLYKTQSSSGCSSMKSSIRSDLESSFQWIPINAENEVLFVC